MAENVAAKIGSGVLSSDAGVGGSVMCPRCGFDTRIAVAEVSEEDKREYVRSILGDRPFAKVYTLFDGQVKLTLRDLTSAESSRLAKIFEEIPSGATFMVTAVQLKLLFSCVGFVKGDKVVKADSSGLDSLDKAMAEYGKVFGGLSETLCGMMMGKYNAFTQTMLAIAVSGSDKNF